jgi:hypothetical protein
MHPITHYELMQTRVADRHREAERRNIAQAARQTRRAQRPPSALGRSDLARRLFRLPRRWQPSRDAAS